MIRRFWMKTIRILLVALFLVGTTVAANAECRTKENTILWGDLKAVATLITAASKGTSKSELGTMIAASIGTGTAILPPEGTVVTPMSPIADSKVVVVATGNPVKIFIIDTDRLICD
jgi:uncharacterized membrane-anchored protein